jgi:hypothetical protein
MPARALQGGLFPATAGNEPRNSIKLTTIGQFRNRGYCGAASACSHRGNKARAEQKMAKSWATARARPKNNLASSPEWVNKCAASSRRGSGKVRQISGFVLGFALACASATAPAQDLTAGKTPAQLFHSDCAECHHSPSGIARTRDVRALADFLREHYTSKSETASALAAYVSSFAATGAAARNRGAGVAVPVDGEPPQAGRRNRGHRDAAAADARLNASPVEDTIPHRRHSGESGDGETRGAHRDSEVPRPPGGIPATSASAKTRDGEPRDTSGPPSRMRSRSSSGRSSESANVESGKTAAPKARKRRNRIDNAEPPAPDVPAGLDPAVHGTPREGNVSPLPPPAATSPPAEQ